MSEQNDKNDGIKDPGIKIEYTIKNGWKRIGRFVEKHPTISASVITGIISWKMSKRHTLKKAAEVGTVVYHHHYGDNDGSLELQRDVLVDFITSNDLGDQLAEFMGQIRTA